MLKPPAAQTTCLNEVYFAAHYAQSYGDISLIYGEAGVGKSAVVDGLALKIANNEVPDLLKGKTIFSLEIRTELFLIFVDFDERR